MSDEPHFEPDEDLQDLIHAADLDGLVRMIDNRCSSQDWDGLLRVRDRSRSAVKTGRQLWPAATLAEYRLALLAPPPFVGIVLDEADGLAGRFTTGPLTEVAAQHHTWIDLEGEVGRGPHAAFVAHERAIRGEIVNDPELAPVLDIPTEVQGWEPRYEVATYSDNGAEFPAPDLSDAWEDIETSADAERLDDDVELAVRQLLEPWTSGSNGRAEVVCVEGDIGAAIGALGVRRARIAPLEPAEALAWLAWAGASGGAHGRRRGASSGRFGAWWVIGALGDMLDDWPVNPDEIGQVLNDLEWFRWDAFEPAIGWILQLAIEDPDEGVAWAISARDAV
ncbi:MAG: hypothetical protein ACI9N0_000301 [Ilumatobacter sp.]|jgi:hypothetical protein